MLGAEDHLPHRPRRILVAGVSGVGKTTLAARIAGVVGARHTEIDGLFHGPDWTPREQFLDDVDAFTSAPEWVTEWQYRKARALLVERADLLVWLDLPYWRVTLPRVVRRTIRRRLRREVLWNGNVEPPLWTFFTDPGHIVRWSISTRNKYAGPIPAAVSASALTVVRLRSQREVERWIEGSLREAIAD